jgi:hypothetical protein
LLPPRVTCTTWRSVLLDNPGAGGLFWRSVNCWALNHVHIQHSLVDFDWDARDVQEVQSKRIITIRLDFFNVLILDSISFHLIKKPLICMF